MSHHRSAFAGCAIGFALFVCSCRSVAQVGDVTGVHDPSIIQFGGLFYLFSTGRGITVHTSTDLFHWKRADRLMPQSPAWTSDCIPRGGSMWAPDISFTNGEYRLYYAVSAFGKTSSAIGLSVNKTLDVSSKDYLWSDRGKVISTPEHNQWNAIDPCAFEDSHGNDWMVLGSCWSGLKLIQLDRATGLMPERSPAPLPVAAYPPGNLIEEGYIRRHGDFYYLWESVDHCCRGVDSTYRILVGRSKDVRGPYIDRDGKPMLRGGGTLVLASYDNVRGPGSCAIIHDDDREFLVHHEYDCSNWGTPTLQIRPLFWDEDGWPVAGEPITRPPTEKPPLIKSMAGSWKIRFNFERTANMRFQADGTISPGPGTWREHESRLELTRPRAARGIVDTFNIADDGSFFTGRDQDGSLITGTRVADAPP